MQHFVDREQELQTLHAEYDRPGSALVVLYGRRRVGKTTLISEFIREKPARNPKPKTVPSSRKKPQSF